MHDLLSMLADLNEAIADAPVAVTVIHKGGIRATLSVCAVSDIVDSSRVMDDEGVMESADISVTFPTGSLSRSVQAGDKVIYNGRTYRVLRPTRDRLGVSTTLECKEAQ
jgi:hypothetical protein